VVGMSMGVDDPAHPPAFLVQLRQKTRGRSSRVHHQGLPAGRTGDQVGDDLKRADFLGSNNQGHAVILSPSVRALASEKTENHLLVFEGVDLGLDGHDMGLFTFILGLAGVFVRHFILTLHLIFLGLF
jgi:hypothetical protein